MTTNNHLTNHERHNLLAFEFNQTLTLEKNLLDAPPSMTETALRYAKSGLSVIPVGQDKRPIIAEWKPFQMKPAHVSLLTTWWQHSEHSIAIVCGSGSGNLEVLDFDEKFNIDATPIFLQWKALVEEIMPGLADRLTHQRTQNNGYHCLYRCDIIEGNQKLAQRAVTAEELEKNPHEKSKTLIETRGEGGYALCYPSKGYSITNGELTQIAKITPEERKTLLACARALNRLVDERKMIDGEKQIASGRGRPGDYYNEKADVPSLLTEHGWVRSASLEKHELWRRPGKSTGVSATYFPETKVFYNFSSNASGLEVDRGYTPFSLYTMLEAGGDFQRAAKQLAIDGYTNSDSSGTKLGMVENQLNKEYELRRNTITQKIEYRRIESRDAFREMRDSDLNTLHCELHKENFEIGFDAFCRLLNSDFVPEYDPFKAYFSTVRPWDGGHDHIHDLAQSLALKNPTLQAQFEECLRRWLIAYVGCALDPEIVNHTAIILVGEQGRGKTRWLNRLVPESLSKYRFIGTINPEDKDSKIILSECMLINLDELETMRKADIGSLKSVMTMPSVKLRRPYGRLTEDLPRRASFVGSINHTEFLNDSSGSRRFLVFEIESFDFEKYPSIDAVLAQAHALYLRGERHWFEGTEIDEINERNKDFAVIGYEEEMLLRRFHRPIGAACCSWKTATEIANEIRASDPGFLVNDRTVRNLGIALMKHGYMNKKSNGSKKYAVG